ncbi:HAD-IB family hydrolase [Candidatus Parcubacteria bacterium]|nr:HAD-IB family hydrolase [Candidatus Parcubacteria bacterium]
MSYAFFDLDKTLITKNSYEIVLTVLRRRRVISWYRFFYYKFILFFTKNIDKKMKMLARVFKDVDVMRLDKIIKAFIFTEFDSIKNIKAVEELEKHNTRDKKIVLVTTSFEPIAKYAAKFFHIHDYVATKLEVKNGKYTGKISGKINYKDEKVHRLSKYNFENSFAYSDHNSDIPLLKKATYRYTVSPNKRLRAYAKNHGWFILE